ncbi:hypothetical protein HanIR_Chr11g0510811 [Helianthus annuus]|nr:hypothetical protein HanIR_Chr11g0510811 [Helianthus annuus]
MDCTFNFINFIHRFNQSCSSSTLEDTKLKIVYCLLGSFVSVLIRKSHKGMKIKTKKLGSEFAKEVVARRLQVQNLPSKTHAMPTS